LIQNPSVFGNEGRAHHLEKIEDSELNLIGKDTQKLQGMRKDRLAELRGVSKIPKLGGAVAAATRTL
jgi:hypothetical protein